MDRETPADGDNNGDADPGHHPEADEGEAEPYPISITTEEKPRPKTDQAAPREEKTNINIEAAAPLRETESTVALTITHPTQTGFTCPACTLTYTTHNSLARHVGVSHERLALDISFKCALCEYVHVNLRSTSSHFRQTHGAVVPPVNVDDAREKACPFNQRPFPSVRLCSTLIRERHMKERAKWGEGEVAAKFKEALKTLGPDSNIKLAAAIGTMDAHQVNSFKCRFLKANPSWLKDNFHPARSAAGAPNFGRPYPAQSPPSSQAHEDNSPASTTSQQTSARDTGARPARHLNTCRANGKIPPRLEAILHHPDPQGG
ncbi:hypothetical protein EMCRGX_G005486 [Ephydatia muelleri]